MSADRLGARSLGAGRWTFVVWAPKVACVDVHFVESGRLVRLQRDEAGYHRGECSDVPPDARYVLRLENGIEERTERPDPASRSQPDGVHGPSMVFDPAFEWSDEAWRGLPLARHVVYELHTGTFSAAGTFDGVIPHLARLCDLGITVIELMPVAQFPGTRNWGYDGVLPFAAQHSYGGPRGLQRLVDACHAAGLAVCLDVVYNHLGPEGNYLGDFGPYFTDVYRTPWGQALNFDGPHSDHVRRFFVENALQWIEDFHIDALRLDAVHAMIDRSAYPFLEELADRVHERARLLGREVQLVAESDSNDPRLLSSSKDGGIGLDGMWCDDLHHSLHALLTGERSGYYVDFGEPQKLGRAWECGFSDPGGESRFRRRRHGRLGSSVGPARIVVCAQNHDQVGNRMLGERLSTLVDFEAQKLGAGVVLLSPHVPLLFMGEEYGETAPFLYFVEHGDEALIESVRRGRKAEFSAFGWSGEPPDPQSAETFTRSRLDHDLAQVGRHALLLRLHADLIALRVELSARGGADVEEGEAIRDSATVLERSQTIAVHRPGRAWMLFHCADSPGRFHAPVPTGTWRRRIASADAIWGGPGSVEAPDRLESANDLDAAFSLPPWSFVVYSETSAEAAPTGGR